MKEITNYRYPAAVILAIFYTAAVNIGWTIPLIVDQIFLTTLGGSALVAAAERYKGKK